MLDFTLSLLLLMKHNTSYEMFFFRSKRDVTLSVTFQFWVNVEFIRRHGKRRINNFDFGVEYKPNGQTCKFQYQ